MRHVSVISEHPILIGFLGLTGCQRDPRDRGVTKTLTFQYMCILVGSSQFCGWFSFDWKIFGENGKNWQFLHKSQVSASTES